MCWIYKVDFSIGHSLICFICLLVLWARWLLFHTRLIGSCCHAAQLLDVNGESKIVLIPIVVAVSSCLPSWLDTYPVCIFIPWFWVPKHVIRNTPIENGPCSSTPSYDEHLALYHGIILFLLKVNKVRRTCWGYQLATSHRSKPHNCWTWKYNLLI